MYCEFSSLIWSSNYLKYKNEFDNVQHNFLKRRSLILLSVRYKLTDVMFVYNILNNHIDFPKLLSEIGFCMSNGNTRNVIYS
ncbi:Reverse transcriptase domain-containing protein [Aphis craccivora]|uniref:Reverse transcriptase domain-containing protein n=1 Tax=Aphis craccivora TaxID=307492 RepID=A0A6G0XZR0_APHCR|nr:Reverse transcriptase domain-containing protein [Aphis craccivora]